MAVTIPDQRYAEFLEQRAQLKAALAALDQVKSAIGDRLLAGGPLSKPYAHAVIKQIDEALAGGAFVIAEHDERVRCEAVREVLEHLINECAHTQAIDELKDLLASLEDIPREDAAPMAGPVKPGRKRRGVA